MSEAKIIKVGMADLKVAKAPDILTTLGLGSCVGIALYDNVAKIGGLAHIMLPDSTQIKNNSNVAKFADTAIEQLIYDSFEVSKVLVVAPLRVARNTWSDEIHKWDHLKHLRYSIVLGSAAERTWALPA